MANRVELEAILKFVGVDINTSAFSNISRATAGISTPIQQFDTRLKQAAGSAQKVEVGVRRVRQELTNAEKVSNLFLRRMAQFAVLLPTFATLNKVIQGSVKFLFDFDKQIQDIIKADVGALSGKFDAIAKSAFNLSKEFGTSAIESAEVIKTYVQAGFDLQKANELARLSILGVKSSTLDSAQAIEYLLSVTKQFGLQGQDLTKALDALVNVEGVSAVEAKDVAEAFSTGGNSLAQFSRSINDSIGLISALREQTRKSGSEIGTIFKTLQARIFAAGTSREAVEGLGVSVQNLDGTLRPTLDVLNDLASAFGRMTEAQQTNAAKTIAGIRQYEGLLAIIKSIGRANQLSAEASKSDGAAKAKNAVDAEKLTRKFDDLVVAAQELALALGQAGGTDALKEILKFATLSTEAVTKLVTVLGKIHVPALPILAPLAFKAIGSVFGFGGGPGGGGGLGRIVGGGPGRPGAGGGFDSSVALNTKALKQLSEVIIVVSQQMKVLSQATMTQSQLMQTNIALENLQNTAIELNTKAQQENAVAMAADIAETKLLTAAYAQQTNVVKKAGLGVSTAFNSVSNGALKGAIKFTALTLGATAVTAVLNSLASKLGGEGSFAGSLTGTAAAATQMGLQFAILGPEAAALAAIFTALTSIGSKYVDAAEDSVKASKELAEAENRQAALAHAPKALTSGVQGLEFLQAFGRTIKGRSGKELDLNRSVNEGFKALDPAARSFIKNVEDLKEVLFAGGDTAKETIKQLAAVNSEAFVNQEALNKLRGSYDENGKSSLTFQQQLNLLLEALGKTAEGAGEAADSIQKNLIYTFEQMQKLQEEVGLAQSINKLGREFEDAARAPKDLLEGLDKLQVEASRAATDLNDVQRSFDSLVGMLVKSQHATAAGLDIDAAKKFTQELQKALSVPDNGKGLSDLLSSKTSEERDFAKEYLKLEKDRYDSVLKLQQANQAVQVDIYKHQEENLKNLQAAEVAAADGMVKFKNALIKVGSSGENTKLLPQITSLKSTDIKAALSGKSNLPQAIQEVISNTFVDGVKKAETDIKKVSEETANAFIPIDLAIGFLKERIAKLGTVLPNTTNAQKKHELELELAAKQLERSTAEQDGYIKSLEALRTLTVETKKAQEEEARAKAELEKKTKAVTDASYNLTKAIHDINKGFEEFTKQKFLDLQQKEADAYQTLKSSEQEVLTATQGVSSAWKDLISTMYQVNGALVEAQVKANLLHRDIGMLDGGIVTFQQRLGTLNKSFSDAMADASMKLDQRIQLEKQLADQTLAFLKDAQDQITSAGLNVFGQSAQENNDLQRGIAGLSYVAQQLGGSFKNFLGMKPDQINQLSEQLLNLPLAFRKEILDALQTLPSSTSIGGFSADQLKTAIGQLGAGVAPGAGLESVSDLTAQQVEQLKILGNLGTQEAKLQLTQVVIAQQQLDKAKEQLDVAKIQEDRAKEGLDQVRATVQQEVEVLDQANSERRDLLQQVVAATNTNALHAIENEAQLFADQNSVFRDVGDHIVQGVTQAIEAKSSFLNAQTSLGTFNTLQEFQNQATGFIPNFAGGNLSVHEAGGLLRAAIREKRMMPHGASLAVANTREAIIPMYRGFIPNFADGNPAGSAISASINSIRGIDQTMVAAISQSVTNTLSQISAGSNNAPQLEKISSLLSDLNTAIADIKTSNDAIKNNTSTLQAGTTKAPGVSAVAGQEVKISLETNQNSTVQITGLDALRDQLRSAVKDASSSQVEKQLEPLLEQLDSVFKALSERGIISSFGQSR
jgi:TP901 family phage tail tape measure protein